MELYFSDSTSQYYYSALLQSNAAIIALLGLYTIFKIQVLQSSIESIKLYLKLGNTAQRNFALDFEIKNIKEKKDFINKIQDTGIEELLLKKWYEYDEDVQNLKQGIKTPTLLLSIAIICNTSLLLFSSTLNKYYMTLELIFALSILVYQIIIIITITFKILKAIK